MARYHLRSLARLLAQNSLGTRPLWQQAALLILLSGLLILLFEAGGLPAAFLLAPMMAAIYVAVNGSSIRIPHMPSQIAQGIIGCLIAQSFTPQLLASIADHLPLFFISVLFVILVSTLLGYCLARFDIIAGTTAIWGSTPGAASIMTMLSASYGADQRLVAFMQYLRVAMVAAVASLVTHFLEIDTSQAPPARDWLTPVDWFNFGQTMLFILVAVAVGRLSRLPSAPLMLPLFSGIALQMSGIITIELPPILLALSFMLVGWKIGLSFTRGIILHAIKAFPMVLLSTLILIGICGLYGWLLSSLTGIDPLTTYLATSPGGADTMAIISATSPVDVPFVMAMQTMRFFVILFIGPALARFFTHKISSSPL